MTIIFALGIGIATTFYTQYQINRARQITELEKIGNSIDKQFTFSQLESLIEAIKAGEKLKSLVNSQQSLSDYPTVSPISTLLNIIRKIQVKNEFQLQNYTIKNGTISFSPDGTVIAGTNKVINGEKERKINGEEERKIVQLWHPIKGTIMTTVKPLEYSEESNPNPTLKSLKFSPDSRMIAGITEEGTVNIWNREQKTTPLKISKFPISNLKFSPNGQMLAVTDIQGTVELWSLTNSKPDKVLSDYQEKVDSLYFSQDSQKFSIASQDGKIKTWQLSSLFRESMPTRGIFFTPNSKLIILTKIDGTIELIKNGNLIKSSKETSEIKGIFFHPEHHSFVTAREDGIIQEWSEQGELLKTILNYPGNIRDIAFNAVNKTMAIADDEGAVIGYTLAGKKEKIIIPKDYNVRQFAFHTQGEIIAFVNGNNGISLWDSESQKITSIENSNKPITDIDFNQDGSLFAVSYQDGTIQMWTSRGTPFLLSIGQEGSVASFDFKSSKNTLIITDNHGNISSFELTIDALLQKGCSWLQDYFQSSDKAAEKQSVCPEKM